MKVGQIVYVSTRHGLKETKIEKIGRKYIYLEDFRRKKFNIETLREIESIGTVDVIYLSKEDWESEQLHFRLHRKFRRVSWEKLSLEKLKEVDEILKS